MPSPLSRPDQQCFSHEDGCLLPETIYRNSLSELLQKKNCRMQAAVAGVNKEEIMKISEKQLAQVNDRIKALITAGSFYGKKKLEEAGITSVANAEEFEKLPFSERRIFAMRTRSAL